MSGRWKRPNEDEHGAGSCGAEKLEHVETYCHKNGVLVYLKMSNKPIFCLFMSHMSCHLMVLFGITHIVYSELPR